MHSVDNSTIVAMYMTVAVPVQNKHHTLYYCCDNQEGQIWSATVNIIMGTTNVVLVAVIDTADVL